VCGAAVAARCVALLAFTAWARAPATACHFFSEVLAGQGKLLLHIWFYPDPQCLALAYQGKLLLRVSPYVLEPV
jgi:hypothetical protein